MQILLLIFVKYIAKNLIYKVDFDRLCKNKRGQKNYCRTKTRRADYFYDEIYFSTTVVMSAKISLSELSFSGAADKFAGKLIMTSFFGSMCEV